MGKGSSGSAKKEGMIWADATVLVLRKRKEL